MMPKGEKKRKKKKKKKSQIVRTIDDVKVGLITQNPQIMFNTEVGNLLHLAIAGAGSHGVLIVVVDENTSFRGHK
jgi:hypothetical protein